jgi:hypothetical protein
MVVITEIVGFVWAVTSCSLVDVSEEHSVYIFRSEMCGVKNLFGQIDTAQGMCPHWPTEKCKEK